ncbi:MAG: hypothetical protein VKI81_11455, partial [Synechococcaceae cyanobacterium]|nr:hypothetical protein [Synechococcaceae cyanobacterium]
MSIISAGEVCSFDLAKFYLTDFRMKKNMLDIRNIGCPLSKLILLLVDGIQRSLSQSVCFRLRLAPAPETLNPEP